MDSLGMMGAGNPMAAMGSMSRPAPPLPPPLGFAQFVRLRHAMDAKNRMSPIRMNPLQLPHIEGLRGQYATRRRRRLQTQNSGDADEADEAYEAVLKCVVEVGYRVCVEYERLSRRLR